MGRRAGVIYVIIKANILLYAPFYDDTSRLSVYTYIAVILY